MTNFALLEEILSIPSVNNTLGEQILAETIEHKLKQHDIDCYLMPVSDQRSNVIAKIPGQDKSKTIIWNGHLDTVDFGERSSWNTDPSIPTRIDNRLYVRGGSDMKSGIAGMLEVILRWQEEGRKPKWNIVLVLTCDEEKGGTGAMAMLGQDILNQTEAFFIAEPTALQPCIAQKGCIWLELKFTGKASHGAYPEEGVNALEEGFTLCQSLKEYICSTEDSLLGKATAQITVVEGGAAANITAEAARFVMDIRTVPGITYADIERLVQEWQVAARERSQGILTCELNPINLRDAISVPEDDLYLNELQKQIKAVDPEFSAENISLNFFTDASAFVLENNWAPMILFGPGEAELCHQANEYLDLNKYEKYVEILDQMFA